MKKCAGYKYSILAGVSLLFLCSCEQLGVESAAQPSSSEAELMRKNGNALIDGGQPQEAIIIFDKLIEQDPHNALAYNGKAVAFDHSGNHLAAQELYKTALSLSPDSLPIRNNLAMSMIMNNQTGQATKLLETLVKGSKDNNPMSHIIRHNLALAYGLSGQYVKATKLNLRDMSKKQAEENISFYKKYAAHSSKSAAAIIPQKGAKNNIGFITSPLSEKNIKPKQIASATENMKIAPEEPQRTFTSKVGAPDKPESSEFVGQPVVYDYPK